MITEKPRELPGYKKKSFSLFFNGGEIWFEHLDGLYNYEELVIEKLNNDKAQFYRPSSPGFVCFNLDETTLSDRIITEIIDSLVHTNKIFLKVCFVGMDRKSANKIKKGLHNSGIVIAFINDFQKAKEWLI